MASIMACGSEQPAVPALDAAVDGRLDGGLAAVEAGTGACRDYSPLRNAYFGDLHAHTSFSLDAYGMSTRNDPFDAYRFAKGGAELPLGDTGKRVAIDRKLDFLAVTDHAESFSTIGICTLDAGVGVPCRSTGRDAGGLSGGLRTACDNDAGVAGCSTAATVTWGKVQEAAAAALEPCTFTSLVAYEWSSGATGNLHRNVIFSSDKVPSAALDSDHYATPLELWKGLESQCRAEQGCDAITIPHNSNYSQGTMWNTAESTPAHEYMEKYQVLAEVYQHKGASECIAGQSLGDEECAFEEAWGRLGDGESSQGTPAVIVDGMIRNGLARGLGYLSQSGKNPVELGFVGASDTHNGMPGAVREDTFPGHSGTRDDQPNERLGSSPKYGPGGLTGVWAPENTRQEIFAALRRRETFATSGPRIAVRMFAIPRVMGARELGAICGDATFPANVLALGGRAMGERVSGGTGATFVVSALADTADLQEIDIVRVYLDTAGNPGIKIAKIPVGNPRAVCVTYEDPLFDAARPSLYYARVYEVPTYRWSHYDCVSGASGGQDCAEGGSLNKTIRERAWTSPIFFRAQ